MGLVRVLMSMRGLRRFGGDGLVMIALEAVDVNQKILEISKILRIVVIYMNELMPFRKLLYIEEREFSVETSIEIASMESLVR